MKRAIVFSRIVVKLPKQILGQLAAHPVRSHKLNAGLGLDLDEERGQGCGGNHNSQQPLGIHVDIGKRMEPHSPLPSCLTEIQVIHDQEGHCLSLKSVGH